MKTEPQIREVSNEIVRLNPDKTVENLMNLAEFNADGNLENWYISG